MKVFCLTILVVVFLLFCTYRIQAQTTQTKLNQVELMRQFLGTWKVEFGKDTTTIINYRPFGAAIEGNFKIVTKDKILDSGQELWGYDKKYDKIIVTSIKESFPEINIQVYWFTSKNTCKQIFPYEYISKPQKAPVQAETEFKSPDLFVQTMTKNNFSQTTTKNNKVVNVLTFTRVPKMINQLSIGKIIWSGNVAYTSDILNEVLGLKTGNNYDPLYVKKRLDDNVSSLYLDNGYAWYQANFVENQNINNKVDLTISIDEGLRAKIGEITVKGNIKVPVSDLLKNIELKSGDFWSKRKIINSVLEISSMGKIDPEKISPNPTQNMEKSTKDYAIIDIVFEVAETNKK